MDTFLADNGFDREAIDRAILDEDPEDRPPYRGGRGRRRSPGHGSR